VQAPKSSWWLNPPKRPLGLHDSWPANPHRAVLTPGSGSWMSSPFEGKSHSEKPPPKQPRHPSILHAPNPLSPEGTGVLACEIAHLSKLSSLSSRYEVHERALKPGSMNSHPVAYKLAETFVYVLSGMRNVWQDGEVEEVTAGDCIVWRGGTGIAHAVINDHLNDGDLVLLECNQVCAHRADTYVARMSKVTRCIIHLKRTQQGWSDVPKRSLGGHDGMPQIRSYNIVVE
jgi:uncharacterized cupin superfamily protein